MLGRDLRTRAAQLNRPWRQEAFHLEERPDDPLLETAAMSDGEQTSAVDDHRRLARRSGG